MTTHYLSLVLIEVPEHHEGTSYEHWFQAVSVHHASIKNGLLEVVFANGEIKVFNSDETDDILASADEIIQRALWRETPIPGSNIEPLFEEN